MLTLTNIELAYGGRVLFSGIEGTISPHDRIGLVGPNGSGKTTLLRILAGENAPDAGAVQKAGYVTLGYLAQEEVVAGDRSILGEAEAAFDNVSVVRARLAEAENELHSIDSGSPAYMECLELIGELEHRLLDLDPERLRANAEAVLSGLGFSIADFQRPCREFSGGWQMRVALARLLLRQPSLLLLDEPTNHLDLPSQRWLERFLGTYDGALMLVSHDRAFLDMLCTRTWALRSGRLDDYAGNYTAHETEAAARRAQRLQAKTNQQRELARQQVFIDRFRSKASKASQVQSRIKALERIEIIELEEDADEISFSFPPPPRSGQVVAELTGVTKRYGALTIFDALDLRIERGDKIAVVGPNGAGKSTLVKLLAGVEPFESGERRFGHNVTASWFAQHQSRELDPALTVLETVEDAAGPQTAVRLRTLLGTFLFRGDDAFKRVSVLSGGEKNRLALARMLVQPANLLIMDEPTNHLDMRSKAVLQEALAGFAGTIMVVSHDRNFLDGFINKVVEIRPGAFRTFPGKVAEYLERVEAEEAKQRERARVAASAPDESAASPGVNARERRKRAADMRREQGPKRTRASKLEREIEKGEARRGALEKAMVDPAFFRRGDETKREMAEYESLKATLERTYEEWTTLTEELSQAGEEEA